MLEKEDCGFWGENWGRETKLKLSSSRISRAEIWSSKTTYTSSKQMSTTATSRRRNKTQKDEAQRQKANF